MPGRISWDCHPLIALSPHLSTKHCRKNSSSPAAFMVVNGDGEYQLVFFLPGKSSYLSSDFEI
eukprot:6464589-Amphidinium_carterae.1